MLRDFELGVPFLSALPSEREINVEPRLAFTLDGSRFDSAAVATPFAEHGAGTVKIRLDRFDVGPWLGYLPPSLPVRLQSGLVSADLSLAFEQRPKLSLRLQGDVGVADLKVADADAGDLLQAGSVKVRIDDLRPLERTAKVARIDIDAPHVLGVRNAAGKVNLLLAAETPSGGAVPVARVPLPTTAASAASTARPSSSRPASAASGAAAGAPAPGWKASLAALSIRAGQLDWRDATTSPPAALAVQDFSFDAQAIAWPLEAPVVFKGEGVVGAAKDQGKLAFSGEGNAAGATVKIGLDDLPLVVARPYLQGLLRPPLAGALSADLTLDWKPGDGAPQLRVDARRIAVARLLLGDPKTPELAAEQIELLDARVDTVGPERGHRQAGAAGAAAAPRSRRRGPLECRSLARRGRAGLDFGRRGRPPVPGVASVRAGLGAGRVGGVRVLAPDARHPGDRQGPGQLHRPQPRGAGRARPPRPVGAGAELGPRRHRGDAVPGAHPGRGAGRSERSSGRRRRRRHGRRAGRAEGQRRRRAAEREGDAACSRTCRCTCSIPTPTRWSSSTSRRRRPASRARSPGSASPPAPAWRCAATPASTTSAPPARRLRARCSRRGLAMVREAGSGPPLLNWKSLSLRGIDIALAPGAPARVTIAETALSDFFARVVLDEEGRLNLQQVARPGDAASAPAAAGGASSPASAAPATAAASPVAVAAAPAQRRPGRCRSSAWDRSRSSTAGSRSTIASSSRTTAPT